MVSIRQGLVRVYKGVVGEHFARRGTVHKGPNRFGIDLKSQVSITAVCLVSNARAQ